MHKHSQPTIVYRHASLTGRSARLILRKPSTCAARKWHSLAFEWPRLAAAIMRIVCDTRKVDVGTQVPCHSHSVQTQFQCLITTPRPHDRTRPTRHEYCAPKQSSVMCVVQHTGFKCWNVSASGRKAQLAFRSAKKVCKGISSREATHAWPHLQGRRTRFGEETKALVTQSV